MKTRIRLKILRDVGIVLFTLCLGCSNQGGEVNLDQKQGQKTVGDSQSITQVLGQDDGELGQNRQSKPLSAFLDEVPVPHWAVRMPVPEEFKQFNQFLSTVPEGMAPREMTLFPDDRFSWSQKVDSVNLHLDSYAALRDHMFLYDNQGRTIMVHALGFSKITIEYQSGYNEEWDLKKGQTIPLFFFSNLQPYSSQGKLVPHGPIVVRIKRINTVNV